MTSVSLLCACLALLSLPACKSRAYNSAPVSTSKVFPLSQLVKTSDLAPEKYLEVAGDMQRLTMAPPPDYRADFAICERYPYAGCGFVELKAGILGPLADKQQQLVKLVAAGNLLEGPKTKALEALAEIEKDIRKETLRVEKNASALESARAANPSFHVANPVQFVTAYLRQAGREPPRIAAATVLKYMRKLRRTNYEVPLSSDLSSEARARRKRFLELLRGDNPPKDPGKSNLNEAKDAEEARAIADRNWYKNVRKKANGGSASPLHRLDWIEDLGDEKGNATLNSAPPHWNDLQAHFYAVTGHRRHGCYTSVLRAIQYMKNEADLPELIKGEGKMKWGTIRDTAVRFCTAVSKDKTGLDASRFDWAADEKNVLLAAKAVLDAPPPDFTDYELDVALSTRVVFRKMWTSLIVGNETEESELKGVLNPLTRRPYNIFDYVMLAPVWSQNFDQQQAIINAFYHDFSSEYGPDGIPLENPSAAPVDPYVPGTSMGCDIRPIRSLVDADKASVCKFDIERASSMHDIGR
jgi:hypothetical protein